MLKLLDHPLTDRGLERFLDDWEDHKDVPQGGSRHGRMTRGHSQNR